MANRPDNILVTGGAGFIGSHLVERLLADGKSVTVIDDCSTGRLENLETARQNPNLEIITARISECGNLAELARKSETIYHLAAAVGVELVMDSALKTIDNNLRETQLMLEAASESGTPILITSTSEVYGRSAREAFSEEDDLIIGSPHLSRWSYACSKLMDEFLALAHFREKKTPVVVTRLFNTVGPRQTGRYGMVLPRFIEAAKKGEPLKVFGDGRQTRCFCYVNDTVEALVRLQNCPDAKGEIFNVGSCEEVSISRLAELVIEAMHSKSLIEYIPYARACGPGFEDMFRRKPVVDKLSKCIGFKPSTSLHTIIERTSQSAQ